TGLLHGLPSNAGSQSFVVEVAGGAGSVQSQYKLVVARPLQIATKKLKSAKTGSLYGQNMKARRGVGPYTWSLTGLPRSLTINAQTGTISGTPKRPGIFNPDITVTDGLGGTVERSFLLSITGTAAPIGFGPATHYDAPGMGGGTTKIGDLNGDGRNDVVYWPTGGTYGLIYYQNNAGGLDPPAEVHSSIGATGVAPGALTGDA